MAVLNGFKRRNKAHFPFLYPPHMKIFFIYYNHDILREIVMDDIEMEIIEDAFDLLAINAPMV